MTLASYVESVRGEYIDVDGVFGAQCWDQWSHYATVFNGVPAWQTYTNAGGVAPHGGYACNVYHNARAAGLTEWFEMLPPTSTPRAGDVAFWEYGSAWYPWSHVATVLAPPSRGLIRCLTQNPGAVQVADLIMRGIIGYLRPRSLTVGGVDSSKSPTKTNSEREDQVMGQIKGIYYTKGKDYIVGLFNPVSGFFSTYSTGDPSYNNKIAGGLQTGSYTRVTRSHFEAIKRDCEAVRLGR